MSDSEQTPPAAPEVVQRPRFVDQVLGMRAVVAVALASLVVGGVGGAVLGATTDNGNAGFGPSPGAFGIGPDTGWNGQNQIPNPQNGFPDQQFGPSQNRP
jgi:hypothetical protein